MKIRVFVWESSSYKLKEQTSDGTKELQLGSQLFNSRVSSLESVWTKAGGSSDRVQLVEQDFSFQLSFCSSSVRADQDLDTAQSLVSQHFIY